MQQPNSMQPIVQGMFNSAVQDFNAGRFTQAEKRLGSILSLQPRHAASLNALGLILYRTRRYDAAAELLERAIRLQKDDAAFHLNLGNVRTAQGQIGDAAAWYRHALRLQPDYAEAHNNLGLALSRQGKRDEAAAHFKRALQLQPNYADAHTNLGTELAVRGETAAAISHYQRALTLNPHHAWTHMALAGLWKREGRSEQAMAHYLMALAIAPEEAVAHNDLGLLLQEAGRLDEATGHYLQALNINPDYADAHHNLASALVVQGRTSDGMAHYRRAIEINPSHAEANNNLGNLYCLQGRYDDAIRHYERAIALKPGYMDAECNLGAALAAEGRMEEAMTRCGQALAAHPDQAGVNNNLGNIFAEQGQFEAAMKHYGQALAAQPDCAEAHFNRAEIKTFHAGDPDLAALEAITGRKDLPENKALHIHFALAKAYEDSGMYDRAFEQMSKGNTLKRRQVTYDEASAARMFERVSGVFGRSLFEGAAGAGDPSATPIFILGMPRSGSSLVEQILASHPQIQGAGELTVLETAIADVRKQRGISAQYPECISALERDTLRMLGEAYVADLPGLLDGKTRITDKMPGNFLHIGLIRLILPNAKIIHTRRDPIDTCVSCYSKLFTAGVAYSYDLAELARCYRRYDHMMKHWNTVLPADAILDIHYEDVVDDLETQARRLIAYCGLAWEDRCIAFHRNSRTVRTASAAQVRKPLFRSSLQRWRRYEAGLSPLIEALGDVISSPVPLRARAAAR